jgi:hypothetical protein
VEERARSGWVVAGRVTAVSAARAGVDAGALGRSDDPRSSSNSAWRAWSSARRTASRASESRRRASMRAARAEAAASLRERRLQLGLGVALHAEVRPSALGVSDGGTNELAVPLAFLGASRPGELQRTSTSCLSLVGGGAILLKAEGASRLLGSASGFPGLGVASASRVLGGAAAPSVNSVGVLGTVLHKVVSPAGRAERGGRASVSQEKRLQYRRQGAASRRSPPGSSRASKLVDERKKGEMVKLRRIIESVYAVPKCNSKTVIPENQSTGCAAEGCTEHDARNWKTPEPSKQPQTATARLRSRGIKAQTAPRGNYRTRRNNNDAQNSSHQ